MQPRRFLLLADNPLTLAQLRAEIEDLGEETRCQTALTAEEALFRLSQESVDAVLLLPCPAADCLTQSLLRHPPLAAPFLLGGLDGELPEISQLPAWFSVLRLPALAAAHLPECTELARQLLTALGMPAIMVPSPYVTNNHQEKNARILEKHGGARVILEKDATGEALYRAAGEILRSPELRRSMSAGMAELGIPDATERIYRTVMALRK